MSTKPYLLFLILTETDKPLLVLYKCRTASVYWMVCMRVWYVIVIHDCDTWLFDVIVCVHTYIPHLIRCYDIQCMLKNKTTICLPNSLGMLVCAQSTIIHLDIQNTAIWLVDYMALEPHNQPIKLQYLQSRWTWLYGISLGVSCANNNCDVKF